MKHHLYHAYGLTISSDFELPSLPIVTEELPHVRIRRAAVPERLDHPLDTGVRFQLEHNRLLLQVDGIARFLVVAGEEILVEPYSEADLYDVRTFLLGSVFGVLLQQRGYLVLRGSAVSMGNQAVLFIGNSGLGKSTLAASFYKRGYKIVADDFCAIKLSTEGNPLIVPGFPWLKLWADSVNLIGEDIKRLQRVRPALEKYELQIGERFCTVPMPLYRLYNIEIHGFDEYKVKEITGMAKVETVLQNRYRSRLLESQNKRVSLQQCVQVANAIEMFTLSRPLKNMGLGSLADYIEKDLEI